MNNEQFLLRNERGNDFAAEIFRYISFWPYFLISLIIFLGIAHIYLRYADYTFKTNAVIEILDKAQDSEMALPTAMTVFNRSMINLSNEIGVLNSFKIHLKTVKEIDANVRYFSVGNLKTSEVHKSEWFFDYNLDFKIDTDTISNPTKYIISFSDNNLEISEVDNDENILINYKFKGLTTSLINHKLPFNLDINGVENIDGDDRILIIDTPESIATSRKNSIIILPATKSSDQLDLEMNYINPKISEDYLNALMIEFDRDGIIDRQLEYKRTIDFVDSRSIFLSRELQQIENNKQKYKEDNNLYDIISDASVNIQQKFKYSDELFSAISQKGLLELLDIAIEENQFGLMPINIGINNTNINEIIRDYNILVKQRDRFMVSAGPNNSYLVNLEKQLISYLNSIQKSIDNYSKSLDLTISDLQSKESEFTLGYKSIPEKEKVLRSIERELEIKESLFLLLLQKREEAAINFAVIKPSIKIIDNARSSAFPFSPKKSTIYFGSIIIAFLIPFAFIFLYFLLDTKIHTKNELENLLNPDIPIIGEIPFLHNQDMLNSFVLSESRNELAESIRMIVANLEYIFSNHKKNSKVILTTSTIKGEGKTICSANIASVLTTKSNKVLLVGADLRNPRLHKFINVDKNIPGLTNFLFDSTQDWKNFIVKHANLDILVSGAIPPNPTQLLSSGAFKKFIEHARTIYDYVIIDSAPCLLVSDTFEISKHCDCSVYVFRANHSDKKLTDYINNLKSNNILSPNFNIVINSVGNSQSYGYKYGYQYGYQYGYKYGYNYGYGYGYGVEDKIENS